MLSRKENSETFKGTGHLWYLSKTQYSHLVYIPTYVCKITNKLDSFGHQSYKKMLKEKTPLLHKFMSFQMHKKGFRPEFFFYLSDKLLLSQKLYGTSDSEGVVSQNVLYYQQLSI